MSIDLASASSFMATHARTLDRRRFELLVGDGDAAAVLVALDGYRNPDGGYGWGLEPDLRATESQPAAALHAFEAIADAGVETPRAAQLGDWLSSISLPDGGVPFALAVRDRSGCAPFWAGADPTVSSLQITAAVVANAYRAARYDSSIAQHPWLDAATRFCLDAIGNLDATPHAYELSFALQVLDAIADRRDEVPALLDRLARHLPPDGALRVAGGTEDEMLRPLDYAPRAEGTVRTLLAPDVVAAELDRLASQQKADGGWPVEWNTYSPAAALEWRGYLTVRAVGILREHSRI